jgi:trans-aconitate methyltransferase
MNDSAGVRDSGEWDALSYHRLSRPQVAWGEKVLGRLPLRGDETVLDAGCGTGRVTGELLERLPGGRVIAVDQSSAMLEAAGEYLLPRFQGRITFLQADLGNLDLIAVADVVFSTATFHWIRNHSGLFRALYRALKPGGLLFAQCGGGPNLARLLQRVRVLLESPELAPHFADWSEIWEFADPPTTAQRLAAAGFVDVETSLEPAPVTLAGPDEYRDFLTTVVVRDHLRQLPGEALRRRFLDQLVTSAAADNPPYLLDYWRLNLSGRRPGSVAAST